MRHVYVLWDDEDNPEGNVQHIGMNGLTREEIEFVLENPTSLATSQSTRRPCVFGYTPNGDFVIVVYEEIAADTVYPITAYEVPEPI